MKYDIEALKRKMLVKYPFFGSVVAGVNYKEDNDEPTASTDGETIYYNPQYLEGLSIEQQTFTFAHEVCHIAFNHILRSEGKDFNLWNIAADGVTNQFLKRDGLKMPPGVIDIEEAINYDVEQLYEKLLQDRRQNQRKNEQNNNQNQENDPQQNPQQNSQQSGEKRRSGNGQRQPQSQEQSGGDSLDNSQEKGNASSKDVGHDTHSRWKDAVRKHKEQKEKSKEKEKSDKSLEENKKKSELEKKQKELEGMGEKDAFRKNLEYKKKQLEDLKEEISKQVLQADTSSDGRLRTVSDIGTAKPLIDWRYVLKEAIKYDVDWSYKNATLEDGVVSPNLEEQPMPETEIVLDTSGSIDEVLLRNFLRECKNILKHSKLKVGCFDTKFYGFHEIRTEKDIENMKFEGGEGTNFNAAVGAFSSRVENKIIFTDGEALMPVMPLDAIWIVFGDEIINPKGGKVIYIPPEQLDKLCSCEIESETKGRSK